MWVDSTYARCAYASPKATERCSRYSGELAPHVQRMDPPHSWHGRTGTALLTWSTLVTTRLHGPRMAVRFHIPLFFTVNYLTYLADL